MRLHTLDNRVRDERDGRNSPHLIDRGFWLYQVPRLTPLCRLLGHKPVVDGYDSKNGSGARWVACDRCGERPEPQGPIDLDLALGQPYTDPLPGPFPASPTGELGGQLVVGGSSLGVGAEFKIGNCGSEQVLAATLTLGRLGALFLHTERHGQWLQRRLNPTGYESRVIGFRASAGHLRWKIWARRDGWSSTDPKWQQGSIRIDLRDIVLGPVRSQFDVVATAPISVAMPEGDVHQVLGKLERVTTGRERWRKTISWSVDWEPVDGTAGIPTKSGDRGRVYGASVTVTHAAASNGRWTKEAAAKIAARLAEMRSRYDYEPATKEAGRG